MWRISSLVAMWALCGVALFPRETAAQSAAAWTTVDTTIPNIPLKNPNGLNYPRGGAAPLADGTVLYFNLQLVNSSQFGASYVASSVFDPVTAQWASPAYTSCPDDYANVIPFAGLVPLEDGSVALVIRGTDNFYQPEMYFSYALSVQKRLLGGFSRLLPRRRRIES